MLVIEVSDISNNFASFEDLFSFFSASLWFCNIQALEVPNFIFVWCKLKSLSYPIYICYDSFIILGYIGKVAAIEMSFLAGEMMLLCKPKNNVLES